MPGKDGEKFFIALESICHRDAEGRSLCRTAFTDITARRQAEAALQRTHDDLEERVRERTEDLRQTVEQLEWEIEERGKPRRRWRGR